MPKKIIIFGASGMLGSALVPELKSHGHSVMAPDFPGLDIRDAQKILEYVKAHGPDAIVNAAGFTQVDRCETEKELAFELNGQALKNIAEAANRSGCVVFHISSDYIFSGSKPGEYLEDDAPGPLSIYGKSKLLGEENVKNRANNFCIIRTSWLFGPGGDNFVTKLLKKSREFEGELKVVSDERGRPTFSRDLAQIIRLAVEKELRGIYHFCNQGVVSWFEYAGEIFEILGEGRKLVPVSAREYGLPAQRPKNSALSTRKIEKDLGLEIRHHREALLEYMPLLKAATVK